MLNTLIMALLTLGASMLAAITGFGMSTILIPFFILFLPFKQVILLVGLIHFFNNIWKLLFFRTGVNWQLFVSFGMPALVGTYFGASFVGVGSEEVLTRVLGAFLVGYALFLYMRPRFKVEQKPLATASSGALSGFSSGMLGLGGALRSAFLSMFDLPKLQFITTNALISIFIDVVRLSTYFAQGNLRLEQPLLYSLLFLIPASFVGVRIGRAIIGIIPQDRFRLVVAGFLLIVGARLLFIV